MAARAQPRVGRAEPLATLHFNHWPEQGELREYRDPQSADIFLSKMGYGYTA